MPQTYSRSDGEYVVILCHGCGAGVVDYEIHDKWHDSLNATAETAYEADRWAGMLRPIG